MMSVPSRPQRSNGNRVLGLGLVLLILFGCASSSVATRNGTQILENPSSGDANEENTSPTLTVDTVEWTLVSDEVINSETPKAAILGEVKKESYDIALLIPFRSTGTFATPALDANKLKFAHFYAGMKYAIAQSGFGGPEINIRTYDTNRSKSDFRKIMSDMRIGKPDLIIGPYETDLIAEAARFAKENRIPLISPWRASTRVTSDNPYFLQLRPNITEYYKKIVRQIRAIQEINEDESPMPVVQPYEGLLVYEDSLMVADSMVFDHVFAQDARVFVLPHFSSRDEGFLYSCLRKLYAEKGDREIFVYAMPLALNSDRVDINILKNLNLRICEYRFADIRNPEIMEFRQAYYDSFGWLPTEDSYFGYDVMNLLYYGLDKYGQYFHYRMVGETVDFVQMSVHIEPYSKEGTEDLDYMMNSHLSIIEFVGDRFTVKNIR